MTEEDAEKAAEAVVNFYLSTGHKDIRFFEGGPERWAKLPAQDIKEEHVPEYLAACLFNEKASSLTFSATKRSMLHTYVDMLANAFDEWAKDAGRTDLLLTVGERLERAVKP
jgi:hypothetical protein